MSLPEIDVAYLGERGIVHEIVVDSGMTCVVMPQWPLPRGFDRDESDLLIRLSPGYPDVPPDMWWFSPPVHLANGQDLPRDQCCRSLSRAQLAALVATLQRRAVAVRRRWS